jgi:predicted ribosome quality control (RQC) complex YloA/Tae2 family protein
MQMRKHLTGYRITDIEQVDFDRIAIFKLVGYDEMGYLCEKQLLCEIMGKYANIILLNSDKKVISALKIIDFSDSDIRQVMPGLAYQQPKGRDILSALEFNREYFDKVYSDYPKEKKADRFITSIIGGVAISVARELVYRASGNVDVSLLSVDKDKLFDTLNAFCDMLRTDTYVPTAVVDKDGNPIEYSYMDVGYFGDGFEKIHFQKFSDLFDFYFAKRDLKESMRRRSHDLLQLLNNTRSRINKKLSIQRETLADSEKGEEYKRFGDLITANIYQIKRGMQSFECVDYYTEGCPLVKIELDSRISPSANAQRMYKRYSKAKTAKEILKEQIAIAEEELLYLDSVEEFLDRCESENELNDIRDELCRAGYASKLKGYRMQKSSKSKPRKFITSGGYTLLVGRNNIQNDYLTMKEADKHDIWFHTKDIPGSHVIMKTGGTEPGESDYTEAAAVAAFYSRATQDLVAVDYTAVKNIRKPQGAKPGYVIYKTNYTDFVRPKDGTVAE